MKSNTHNKLNLKYSLQKTIIFLFFLLSISVSPLQGQSPELFEERVLLNNLSAPWGFAFINSNEILITEKRGKLFYYRISRDSLVEIRNVPSVSQNGQGGLLDVALHPQFENNRWVYLTYAVSAAGGQTTALGRGKLIGGRLDSFKELFRALPIRNSGVHFGSRIVFDRNNFLYMSVGDRGLSESAQDTNTHLGKVLRFNDDGTIPASNPFVGVANTKPEIYCWGNRNIQGMAMNPNTGEIFAHEHGPRGGDEINLIKPRVNYGWPSVTFGINYDGSQITPDTSLPGMQLPLAYWIPSIAPCGMTFVRNGQASNEADILIGALAGTHIHWLRLKDNKKILSTRSMSGYARFRDVRQAPDGKIYALTETPNRLVLLRSNIAINNSVKKFYSSGISASCYPNPITDIATLTFTVDQTSQVEIRLLNAMGLCNLEINNEKRNAGIHTIKFETHHLQSGIYFIEIRQSSGSTILKAFKN